MYFKAVKMAILDLEICCRTLSKMPENASQIIKNMTAYKALKRAPDPHALCLLCSCSVALLPHTFWMSEFASG